MKKILSLFICFITLQSNATTWNVTVDDFQFSPATLNVMVGDVIHWTWVGGTHTTTSVTIPVGAASWNNPVNSTQTTFNYTVTKAGTYDYQCNFHAAFGMTASFTASGSLPIVLSSFTLENKNNFPALFWTTSQEVNSDYFSIRRSTDAIHFAEIARIQASGNSSLLQNYSYTDNTISGQVAFIYYTIVVVDKDGKTMSEPIKMFRANAAVKKLIITLSPNPVSDMGHINLQYNADNKGIMIATLTDMQGKTVMKEEMSSEAGVNYGHLHFMNIPAGLYTLHFSLNGIIESYKIIKN